MVSKNRFRGEDFSQRSERATQPKASTPIAKKGAQTVTIPFPASTPTSQYDLYTLEAIKQEIGFRTSGEINDDDLSLEDFELTIEAGDTKSRYGSSSDNLVDKSELSKGFSHLTPGEQLEEIASKLKSAKNVYSNKEQSQQDNLEKAKTSLPFDPYLAVNIAGGSCHIDEDYLEANLDWQPNVNYEASSDWKPKKIKPFDQCNRLNFDIETLGTTPLEPGCRLIMAGFLTEGPFPNLDKKAKVALDHGFWLILKANTDDAERDLLIQTFKLINIIGPDVISAHYGLGFDFSFLYDRAKVLGVPCPIDIDRSRVRYVTSGTDYKGMAPPYFKTYFTQRNFKGYFHNDGSFPQILDTLIAATIDNKVRSNYKSFSLKRLVTDHYKIRKEQRLELSYQEILANWDRWINGGDKASLETLEEYLLEDLRDQQHLTNIYGPLIWSQQAFFYPMAFQDLLLGSPALKWNVLLKNFYAPHNGKVLPSAVSYIDPDRFEKETGRNPSDRIHYMMPEHGSDTYKYKGGAVDATPCIKSNFFKIDVSSLYPSIMLRYGLYDSVKDPLGVMLKALATARKFRYVLKPLGSGDIEKAKSQPAYKESPETFSSYLTASKISNKGADGSMKVVINGCYGFVGVGGYNFNSPKTAALVTAYGRVIMKLMMERTFKLASMVNLDTDGITASPKKADDPEVTEFFEQNPNLVYTDKNGNEISKFSKASGTNCVNAEWIYRYTQEGLPKDIIIDLETNYPKGVIISYKAKNYAYYYHSHTFIPAIQGALKHFGKVGYSTADTVNFSPYSLDAYIDKYGIEGTPIFDTIENEDGSPIPSVIDAPTSIMPTETDPTIQIINPEYIIADAELYLPEWMFLKWDWVYNKKTGYYDSISISYELTLEEDSPEVLEWMYPKTFDAIEPDESLGMFNKRNFSRFKKGYMVEYGRRIGFFGEECAVDYHDHVDRRLKGLSEKHYSDLNQEELEWLTIKRKISANENKIVGMGVGQQGDVVTYYYGDYVELSKSTGKPVKNGRKQPFYVRVDRGEWDELSANPPAIADIDSEFTGNANELNLGISYSIYGAELLELTDTMNKVAFGRMTTEERDAEESRRITLEKGAAKNEKRIAAIKRAEKPYAALLDLVRSGGQCGADKGGIDAAESVGLKTGGEAPKGYKTMTSDGVPGDDISLKRMGLKENRSEKFGPRTRVNVQKSTATVWFGTTDSPGYAKTYEYVLQYQRPFILNPTAQELADFVFKHWVEDLNVAGNRISRAEKLALDEGVRKGDTIYEIAYDTCVEAFNIVRDRRNDSLDEPSEAKPIDNTREVKPSQETKPVTMPLVFGM